MITQSYMTVEEASALVTEYLGTEANSTYKELEIADQKALIHSTQLTFEGLPWVGAKATEGQAEAWPRLIGGQITETPVSVKLAMVYQISERLKQSSQIKMVSELAEAGVTSYAIDDLSISMGKSEKRKERINPISELTPEALTLLRPYLLLGGACYVYA